MAKRTAKIITNKTDIDYLVNLTEEETLKMSFIMQMFGNFKGKKRFNPYDSVMIPKGSYGPAGKKNKNDFYTTVGLWVFNKAFIERDLFDLFKYVGETLTKKSIGKINQKLSYALMEDDIGIDKLKWYLEKTQKFTPYVSILSPSHTLKMLTCTKEIEKKKKELFKQYDKEIKAGDEKTIDKISKELLAYAKEILDGDPSMDMYNSGARGSFDNNFKNMYIMKGLIKDPDPNKGFNLATSSYMTGVKKEEYAIYANSLSAGPYARAKKTEVGGYWEKLFLSAFQHMTLDPPGSDCGTDRYITVDFSKENMSDYMYSYIIEGKNLIELTSKNMSKYEGKKVKMRFSAMCESKKDGHFCNKCAGNMFYRMGIIDVGTATPQFPSKLKVLSMKSFHDSQQRFVEMDPMKAFGLE